MIRLVCVGTAVATLAAAQNTPSFDVVSIRPIPPGGHARFESLCSNGGGFIARGTPLLWSIKWAYGINDYQMASNGPDWLNTFDTYDIEAKSAGPVTDKQCRLMVQSLFEHRFQLRMHRQTKVVSAYALVIAKNGPRLPNRGTVTINGEVKQAASEREAPEGWTMARLANYLASVRAVGRPVLDRTGLSDTFGFELSYSTAETDDRPDIFSGLQRQLGLRLQPIKTPIEMWFVDYVEKPSGN